MHREHVRDGKLFYGWWIVLVSAIGLFMGYGAIISFTFGVFSNPVAREFGWTRTQISLAYSLSLILYCVATPVLGRLIDRMGARKIILPSVLVFGLCLISFQLLAGNLWHFYAIYIAMGLIGGGNSLVPYAGVISHWFDKQRGLALGLAAIGVGMSTFVMPSLAHALIAATGWRGAYTILGLLVIVVTIPVVGFFLVDKPQLMGLLPDGERVSLHQVETDRHQPQGMTGLEALRTGTFWLLFVSFLLIGISVVGCLIHLVPMLTDRGVSARTAAFATSVLGGAVILGRVLSGYLLDRLFASYVAMVFFLGAAIGIFVLWSGVAGPWVFVAAFLIGMGMGAENDIIAYVVSRYFGLRAYSEIYGYVLISFAMGGIIGPLMMGVGFDKTGSYRLILGVFLAATLLGALMMTRLGPYRVWKPVTQVAALLLLVSLVAHAQPPVQQVKVLTGATLIDGTGRPPIRDAVIIIEGARIKAVGPRNKIKVPAGAELINVDGKYIVPGLADMHQHLGLGNFDLNQGGSDYNRNLQTLLGWGITNVFSFGTPAVESFVELKRVSADDTSAYPHFFGVGILFRAREGHGSLQGGLTPDTPEEARRQVRELRAANVDAIKLVHTDLRYVTKNPRPVMKPDVLAAIIDEAHKVGLKAYVHAPVLEFAKQALRAGVDGLVHAVISDPVDDEFIRLMKKNRAVYIQTHAIFEAAGDIGAWAKRAYAFDERGLIPKEVYDVGLDPANVPRWEAKWNNVAYIKQRLPVMRANLKKVWDAGIPVVAGSDTGNSGAGTLLGVASQLEFVLMVEAGLTPQQVIQAATINAARMVNREKDWGTVEAGKLADMVVLDADPLSDIGNVRRIYRVVKGGVIYEQAALLRAA
jgi:imidazolonepropionase-like amidohydrolase/sugar phosphate permease